MTGLPGEQLVEWVDSEGTVVQVVSRSRMRAERLRHRCVYVAVLDPHDRVVVHRRAEWKDVWAGYWDIAFGGVAGVGEVWPAAARRELAEEAGIEAVSLQELGRFAYDDQQVSLLGRAYRVRTAADVSPGDGEVAAVDHVALPDLANWAASRPTCPDSVACVLPLLTASPR